MKGVSSYFLTRTFDGVRSFLERDRSLPATPVGAHKFPYTPRIPMKNMTSKSEENSRVLMMNTKSVYLENSQKMRQNVQDLKKDNKSKYYIEVYFTKTSRRHGSGHVSMSFIEETKERESLLCGHMSYMPTASMTLLNGVSLGTIPVFSENLDDVREDDLHKATSIYRFPVSQKIFERGLQKQHEIKKGVDRNQHLYAVTGEGNILSVFLTCLYGYYLTHNKAIDNYKLCYGVDPSEDSLGIVVTDLKSLPEKPVKVKLYNCTQAVSAILKEMEFPVDTAAVVPNSLAEEVCRLEGVTMVDKSMVPVSNLEPTEKAFLELEGGFHEAPDSPS